MVKLYFGLHWFRSILSLCAISKVGWLALAYSISLLLDSPIEIWCCMFDSSGPLPILFSPSFSYPIRVCVVDPFRYLLLKCIRCAINLMLMSNCNFKPLSDINYLTFFARTKSMSATFYLFLSLSFFLSFSISSTHCLSLSHAFIHYLYLLLYRYNAFIHI